MVCFLSERKPITALSFSKRTCTDPATGMARSSVIIIGEGIRGELSFDQVRNGITYRSRQLCAFIFESMPGFISLSLAVASQAQEDAPTRIDGTVEGLTPGEHGIHIHTFGDFSQGLTSAGGIFNPFGKNHGAPDDEERQVGDLGNVEVDAAGKCTIHFEDRLVKLIGPHSVIGRSVIIKAGADDLGRGGHELSLVNGNSGARLAGGVIGISAS